jgi:hypothetical protein
MQMRGRRPTLRHKPAKSGAPGKANSKARAEDPPFAQKPAKSGAPGKTPGRAAGKNSRGKKKKERLLGGAEEEVLLVDGRSDGDVEKADHHLVGGLIAPTNGLGGIGIVLVAR